VRPARVCRAGRGRPGGRGAEGFPGPLTAWSGLGKSAETDHREPRAASKTTTTTKEGPCPIITALNQTHPEYQDFDLVKVTTVEFRYRSPADGKVHRGKQREENRRETGLKLRRGDDLVVLAHKTKPEETRKH
jgi:hypothetical protein